MSMAPHPDALSETRAQRIAAEGRATRRITLSDPSSPQVRFLRTQASELNKDLATEVLDLLQLLCSGGEFQWRTARSKALKLLNQHNRALRNLITGVLEMDPEEVAKLAQFQAPRKEMTDDGGTDGSDTITDDTDRAGGSGNN
jgi:hypothetical protein